MDKEIIHRYFRNECTEQERIDVQRIIDEDPAYIDDYFNETQWDEFIQLDKRQLDAPTKKTILNRVNREINSKAFSKKNLLKYAAFLLMASGISMYIYSLKSNIDNLYRAEQSTVQLFENNEGNASREIFLPDSTRVLLYSSSTLKLDSSYNEITRKVLLNGRARFYVKSNPNKPFSVYSKHLETLAVGTIFEVSGKDIETHVKLIEGKVKVYHRLDPNQYYTLSPGESVFYGKRDNRIVMEHISNRRGKVIQESSIVAEENTDSAHPYYYLEGKNIEFRNVELMHVLSSLEGIYNSKITLPKELAETNMYLSVDTSLNLQTILKNIAHMNGLVYRKLSDREFILSKK